jgi:hypothetical protein
MLADLDKFVADHRPHGRLEASVGDPVLNGYMIESFVRAASRSAAGSLR